MRTFDLPNDSFFEISMAGIHIDESCTYVKFKIKK
jgi:hypothetical protein